ncbi:hypothetical protein GGF32_004590 [Allomyces javanicus]|nr:hypothetical protein GGF32_004590 [Allomyces javanicus]
MSRLADGSSSCPLKSAVRLSFLESLPAKIIEDIATILLFGDECTKADIFDLAHTSPLLYPPVIRAIMKWAYLPVYLVPAAGQDHNKLLALNWHPAKLLVPVHAADALGIVEIVVKEKDVLLFQKARKVGRMGQQAANKIQQLEVDSAARSHDWVLIVRVLAERRSGNALVDRRDLIPVPEHWIRFPTFSHGRLAHVPSHTMTFWLKCLEQLAQ